MEQVCRYIAKASYAFLETPTELLIKTENTNYNNEPAVPL